MVAPAKCYSMSDELKLIESIGGFTTLAADVHLSTIHQRSTQPASKVPAYCRSRSRYHPHYRAPPHLHKITSHQYSEDDGNWYWCQWRRTGWQYCRSLACHHRQLCRNKVAISTKYCYASASRRGSSMLPVRSIPHNTTLHNMMILIGIIELQDRSWGKDRAGGIAAFCPMAIAAFRRSFRRRAFGGN